MRILPIVTIALPVLASAQQELPLLTKLRDMFEQASNKIQAALAAGREGGNTAKVAEQQVTPLTIHNYQDVIRHSGTVREYNPPEAWMVYVTGGNRTCGGHCGKADDAWQESVALFSRDVSAPKLASIDCETDELICGAWMVRVPSIWFLLTPQPLPDQSPGGTRVHIYPLNATTVTSTDITKIHTQRIYIGMDPYENSMMHPFDGWVAKLGLLMPLAYVLWGLGKIPSWAFMIGLSMVTRTFMSRRMTNPRPAGSQPAGAGSNAPSAAK